MTDSGIKIKIIKGFAAPRDGEFGSRCDFSVDANDYSEATSERLAV